MSALRAVAVGDHAQHDLLHEGRDGAGDESTGSDFASPSQANHVVASGGDYRNIAVTQVILNLRNVPGFSVFVHWDLGVEQRNQGLASGCGFHAISEHDVARADRFPIEALVGVTVRSQRGAAQ